MIGVLFFIWWSLSSLCLRKYMFVTAFKKAQRKEKLALELSAAKRERDSYLSNVERSRALSAIEERLKKVHHVYPSLLIKKKCLPFSKSKISYCAIMEFNLDIFGVWISHIEREFRKKNLISSVFHVSFPFR